MCSTFLQTSPSVLFDAEDSSLISLKREATCHTVVPLAHRLHATTGGMFTVRYGLLLYSYIAYRYLMVR